jgi:hypothetical protein
MPLRNNLAVKDQGWNTVSYRDASGNTFNARVEAQDIQRVAAPTGTGSATATTGGTLVPATYGYKVTKVINGVESLATATISQVVPAGTNTNTVTVSWAADAQATAWKVYGRTGGSETLLTTLAAGSTQFVDTGALTPGSATPPSQLAADALNLRIPGLGIVKGVPPATAMKQTGVYYNRPY